MNCEKKALQAVAEAARHLLEAHLDRTLDGADWLVLEKALRRLDELGDDGDQPTGILNDKEIERLCLTEPQMLTPFSSAQAGTPSWGLGSFGYDIALGHKFLVPVSGLAVVLDPRHFPEDSFQSIMADEYFDLAPHSYVLGESIETFHMPDDVFGVCFGKSTYARCGLLVNVTPIEPGFRGKLTIELGNLTHHPIRLYPGMGIAQVVFFRGRRPQRTYDEKEVRHYQDQTGVTIPPRTLIGDGR